MNDKIRLQCEQSFYQELYHFESGKRSLVMDTVSERISLRKELSFYHTEVFRYLKNHPNVHIPKIHSYWEENGRLIVIEELISGFTLDYILENERPDEEKKKDIIRQICDGLMFLHSAEPQIIHRDLKPANIMVTDDGIVKIIDYDAAKPYDTLQSRDTVLIGTKGRAAPEQYGFGKCDERTDIYGLGVMIREMFPQDGRMQKIAEKATRLEPENRYQHVSQIRKQFAAPREGSGLEKRSLRLPGFRSGEAWKMMLAVPSYLLMICLPFSMDFRDQGVPMTGLPLWINRAALFGIFLSLTDLFTHWSGFFDRLPLIRSGSIWKKIIGCAIAVIVILFTWEFLCVAVVDLVT